MISIFFIPHRKQIIFFLRTNVDINNGLLHWKQNYFVFYFLCKQIIFNVGSNIDANENFLASSLRC
jgi:hypothetical protein